MTTKARRRSNGASMVALARKWGMHPHPGLLRASQYDDEVFMPNIQFLPDQRRAMSITPNALSILFIVPKYPPPARGGLERQASLLAPALAALGHNVAVLSGTFSANQGEYEEYNGVTVYRPRWIQYEHRQGGRMLPCCQIALPIRLPGFLSQFRGVDVVHMHSNSWITGIATRYFARRGIAVVAKMPNFGERGIPGMRRRLFGHYRLQILKQCSAAIALVPESRDELLSIGMHANSILHIPNGIKVATSDPLCAWDRESSTVEVVYAGRLTKQKGTLNLLEAWRTVTSQAACRVRLNIFGDGPLRPLVDQFITDHRLNDSVIVHGYQPDVEQRLHKFDILVAPSYLEGHSNTILEAMRAGLPVVSTSLSGTKLQLGSTGTRYLCEPGDTQGLATRILELVTSVDARHEYGRYLRKRVESIFNISTIAKQYANAYTMLANNQLDATDFQFMPERRIESIG